MNAADGLGWLSERQRDGGVDRVPLPTGCRGELWLCGKQAIAHRYTSGAWDVVVALVERHELAGHYPDYLGWLEGAGTQAIWHPIHDLHAPPDDEMRALVCRVRDRLERGDRVVMHCAAGRGRAGTTAACLLISMGIGVDEALRVIGESRPGAGPEAGVQRELVQRFAP